MRQLQPFLPPTPRSCSKSMLRKRHALPLSILPIPPLLNRPRLPRQRAERTGGVRERDIQSNSLARHDLHRLQADCHHTPDQIHDMDKHRSPETRQRVYLHPLPVPVKRHGFSPTSLTVSVLQAARYLDMQRLSVELPLPHLNRFDVQDLPDRHLRPRPFPRLARFPCCFSIPPISGAYHRISQRTEVRQAHTLIETGHTRGKIVLQVKD